MLVPVPILFTVEITTCNFCSGYFLFFFLKQVTSEYLLHSIS